MRAAFTEHTLRRNPARAAEGSTHGAWQPNRSSWRRMTSVRQVTKSRHAAKNRTLWRPYR